MKLQNVATILSVLALVFFSGCSKTRVDQKPSERSDATVVVLGYLPITHALTIFQEKETLDSEGAPIVIKLQKFSSWSDLTDALNAGSIDGASVLIELAMSAKSKGIDLKAVALGHKDGNVVVVSSKIKDASELKGKTLAIPSTQSSHNILLQEALAQANLTLNDVQVVQLSPTEMPFSLASGSIDGYCVAEPFGAQAVSQGFGRVLYYSEDLWKDSLCCGLVLNQKAIDSLGEEKVALLVKKYYEAGDALDSDAALDVAKRYLGQNPEILKTSLQWIQYEDLRITEEAYQALVDKVKEYGVNDNPPSYEDFVYQPKTAED